jgi:hypothetical protein
MNFRVMPTRPASQRYYGTRLLLFHWFSAGLGKDKMTGPSKREIECLAYRLWDEAGQPKDRDQEFYLEAERQLKEKLIQHELKTPDNL